MKAALSLWFGVLCIIASFSSLSLGETYQGKRVLVLFDDFELKSSHSIFFKNLEARYSVEYAKTDNRSLDVKKYGEWQYDHIVLLSNGAEVAALNSKTALEFVDDGHNMIVATGSSIPKVVREIATECNSEFDEAATNVIDHFHFETSDFEGSHTLIVAPYPNLPSVLGKSSGKAPVLFRGIGQDILEDSPVVFGILSGSETSYSASVSKQIGETVHVAGKKTTLVSALQARNNARVVFAGSVDLFSDKLFLASVQEYSENGKSQKFDKSGNEDFTTGLVEWAFHERSVLRLKSVSHHRPGQTEVPSLYTIKEQVEYDIEIEEWNGKKWTAFAGSDVQLEFIMLDPYVRTFLKPNNGKLTATFQIPDVYGFFTFKVEYLRKGVSRLESIERVPVRPFRHTEYERFIDAAYPYYASATSMLVGLFLFSFVFLYHREK